MHIPNFKNILSTLLAFSGTGMAITLFNSYLINLFFSFPSYKDEF